jgi:hypothetical protein
MPGIFGGVGGSPALYDALRREFTSPWRDCQSVDIAGGILGGHAFGAKSAVHAARNDIHFAVDGEASLYHTAKASAERENSDLFQISHEKLELTSACKGNVAVVDSASRVWYLTAEWTGTFPLYYMHRDGAFIFSSRLHPLAHVMGAVPDPLGIFEFLRRGYILAGRTHYRDIHRLLPGQVITYEPHRQRLQVHETSSLWVGTANYGAKDINFIAEDAWTALQGMVQKWLEPQDRHALMMSAGWDSRLLLAAMLEHLGPDRLLTYSHGDLHSRELHLIEGICRSLKIQWRCEALQEAMFNLDILQHGFDRVGEAILWPHWHHAGRFLVDIGVKCIAAGVYGEILGGHYGPPMLLQGRKKITAVASALLGRSSGGAQRSNSPFQDAYELLRYRQIRKSAWLSRIFWENLPAATEAVNADIATTLRRLEKRGITTTDQLVEAFLAENRGTQAINSQLLSCRTSVDIALPFGDRDLLLLASRILLNTKLHNSLHRNILRAHAPDLLRFPTSATLVPAMMPIFLQEASRALRRLVEDGLWKVHFATQGRIGPPHIGWWGGFAFLRNGRVFHSLVNDLKSDIWDKKALQDSISRIAQFARNPLIYPETFLKIYIIDLMLR